MYIFTMIDTDKESNLKKEITEEYSKGKSINAIAKSVGVHRATVYKRIKQYGVTQHESSFLSKKLLTRQTKVPFKDLENLKNQVQKDKKYFSSMYDPVKGCGRNALAKAAAEANTRSNYSQYLRDAIDNAEQLIRSLNGQQQLLGFSRQAID